MPSALKNPTLIKKLILANASSLSSLQNLLKQCTTHPIPAPSNVENVTLPVSHHSQSILQFMNENTLHYSRNQPYCRNWIYFEHFPLNWLTESELYQHRGIVLNRLERDLGISDPMQWNGVSLSDIKRQLAPPEDLELGSYLLHCLREIYDKERFMIDANGYVALERGTQAPLDSVINTVQQFIEMHAPSGRLTRQEMSKLGEELKVSQSHLRALIKKARRDGNVPTPRHKHERDDLIRIVRSLYQDHAEKMPTELYNDIQKSTGVSRAEARQLVRLIKQRFQRKTITECHRQFVTEFLKQRASNENMSSSHLLDKLEGQLHLPRSQIHSVLKNVRLRLTRRRMTPEQKQIIDDTIQSFGRKPSKELYDSLEEKTGFPRRQLHIVVHDLLRSGKSVPVTKEQQSHIDSLVDALLKENHNINVDDLLHQAQQQSQLPSIGTRQLRVLLKKSLTKHHWRPVRNVDRDKISKYIQDNPQLSNAELYNWIEKELGLVREQVYSMARNLQTQAALSSLNEEQQEKVRSILGQSGLSRDEMLRAIQERIPHLKRSVVLRLLPEIPTQRSQSLSPEQREQIDELIGQHIHAPTQTLTDLLVGRFQIPRRQAANLIRSRKQKAQRVSPEQEELIADYVRQRTSLTHPRELKMLYDELETETQLPRSQVRYLVRKHLAKLVRV